MRVLASARRIPVGCRMHHRMRKPVRTPTRLLNAIEPDAEWSSHRVMLKPSSASTAASKI